MKTTKRTVIEIEPGDDVEVILGEDNRIGPITVVFHGANLALHTAGCIDVETTEPLVLVTDDEREIEVKGGFGIYSLTMRSRI